MKTGKQIMSGSNCMQFANFTRDEVASIIIDSNLDLKIVSSGSLRFESLYFVDFSNTQQIIDVLSSAIKIFPEAQLDKVLRQVKERFIDK